MSMHERSMLAHDLHSLASTMDTIKDENEEEVRQIGTFLFSVWCRKCVVEILGIII